MDENRMFVTQNRLMQSTLVELVERRAQTQPEREVYTFLRDGETESGRLTFGELDIQARSIAVMLQDNCKAGECVLLLHPPGLEFITALLGCFYAGVVAVPIFAPAPHKPMPRILAIASDCQPSAVLTTQKVIANFDAYQPHLGSLGGLPWLGTDGADINNAGKWRRPDLSPQTVAYLQYTSGSTSTPKGVVITHRNALYNSADLSLVWKTTEQSVLVSWLPHFHDFGLVYGVLQPLFSGMRCYLMPPASFIQRPARWLAAITRYRGTHGGAPNFAYELCAEKISSQELEEFDLSSWEVAVNGAEPVRADTLQKFIDVFGPHGFSSSTFCPGYGLAESVLKVTAGKNGEALTFISVDADALERHEVVEVDALSDNGTARTLVACGEPVLDTRLIIVDAVTFSVCPEARVGEIWVSSSSVGEGYWHRDDETEKTFHAKPVGDTSEEGYRYLRTGDLGFLKDGQLYVTGRLKDLIIIRGGNHYPQDIELTVERSHPALRAGHGAAFSIEVEGEEQLVIMQEVARSHIRKLDSAKVIKSIRQAVAQEHDLQVYSIVLLKTGGIQKTSSGKVQRSACKQTFMGGSYKAIYHWTAGEALYTPTTESGQVSAKDTVATFPTPNGQAITHWLVNQVAQRAKLTVQEIDTREPFAAYGIDSAAAVGITGELAQWLKRDFPPTLLYDYATIEALTAYLVGRESSPNAAVSLAHRSSGQRDPIAIIGMGCRFPGASSPEEFWSLLVSGKDAITEIPQERWPVEGYFHPDLTSPGHMNTRWGGFVSDIDKFDPDFFKISPREAARIDPQQRILMEVVWEALEYAGQAPEKLSGTDAGVFVGISSNDYSTRQLSNPALIDGYAGTGNAHSIAANRLSYLLDLHGPSMAVDTACSSSLVALHLACNSLRNGECRMAIAGGVNLILNPEWTIAMSKAGMMAVDGRCRTFDAAASGYVRSEGCGVVILKPLSMAQADGDQILAVIKGTAINQDGRSNGLTAPNGLAQQAVLRQSLNDAGVEPSDISYVETHGTGTPLGDPIEVEALKAVLGPGRDRNDRCTLGAVKTNIGHLEAAAGIAGIVKTVLAMQHGVIPPNLHLQQLNPRIDIEKTPFAVPVVAEAWDAKGGKKLAGVSAFSFGGTNAHVILEEAPVSRKPDAGAERDVNLLTLSAKSEMSLRRLAVSYADYLTAETAANFHHVCFTANVGREHFAHRIAVKGSSRRQVAEQLSAYGEGQQSSEVLSSHVTKGGRPKLVLMFTGQGAQFPGMGRELFDSQPRFRDAMRECDKHVRSLLNVSLIDLLYADRAEDEPLIHQTEYTQPALFALEYALAKMWFHWGLEPDAVMGHSLGEYVAACIAGALSLEHALQLVVERGRLMDTQVNEGMMAAVFAAPDTVEKLIGRETNAVSISAFNGPESVVVSGTPEAVQAILDTCNEQQIEARNLKVTRAFHSPAVEPVMDDFSKALQGIDYHPLCLPLVSNVTGKILPVGKVMDGSYWVAHIRAPVQFDSGMRALVQNDYRVFLEIGPKPTLSRLAKRYDVGGELLCLHTLQQGKKDWSEILSTLAKLHLKGFTIDWAAVDDGYASSLVALPTYPFERESYWIGERRGMSVGTCEEELQAAEKNSLSLSPVELLGMEKKPGGENRVLTLLTEQLVDGGSSEKVIMAQLEVVSAQLELLSRMGANQ